MIVGIPGKNIVRVGMQKGRWVPISPPHPCFLHDQLLLVGLVVAGLPDLFEVNGEEDLGDQWSGYRTMKLIL